MYDTKVLDLGGSLVAPDAIAVEFLKSFERLIGEYLAKDSSRRLIMVIGGGSPARKYQDAYRKIRNAGLRQGLGDPYLRISYYHPYLGIFKLTHLHISHF